MRVRIDKESEYHFTTFNSYQKHHILIHPGVPEMLLEHMAQVRSKYDARIFAFVIMPNHMHIIWYVPSDIGIVKAVKRYKGSFGRRIVGILRDDADFEDVLITQPNGKNAFWQRGFYDYNVASEKKFREKVEYIHANLVKWGLVDDPVDWEWSSYRSWQELPGSVFEVDRL